MLYSDNYAIQTLEKERDLLRRCLEGFTEEVRAIHQTAFKLREKRLKQLNKAIEKLQAS